MKFKNINDILKFLNDDIKNNNEIIYKLLNNSKTEINLSMNISNNNEISNKKLIEVNNEKNPNLENINISKKIRSNYLIKIIFSYLYEKNKFDMVKYNKNWQNKLGVKLVNFKLYNGVCIEYESKIKAKEYFCYTGNLIFEGEYLNGKRNGKGKEYENGNKLICYAEYLEGKVWMELEKNINIAKKYYVNIFKEKDIHYIMNFLIEIFSQISIV